MTFDWLLSRNEVAEQIGKTPTTAKVWLHRHGLKAAKRISVGERATRALYDGLAVSQHQASAIVACPGCVSARRGSLTRQTTGV